PSSQDQRLHRAATIPGIARVSASRQSASASNPAARQATPSSGAYIGRAAGRGAASLVFTARTLAGSSPASSKIARAKPYRETAPLFATWNVPAVRFSARVTNASARSPVHVGDPTWSSTTSRVPVARRMLDTKFLARSPVALRAPYSHAVLT